MLSGGPPITRIDKYCFEVRGGARPGLWREHGRQIVDYVLGWEGQGDFCKNGEATRETMFAALRQSLTSSRSERVFAYPRTRVAFVESEGDKSTRQGRLYYDAVLSQKTWEIVSGNQHGVDRTLPGAERIRELLVNECRER